MTLAGDTLTLAGGGGGSVVSDDRTRPSVSLGWYVDRADPREVRIGRAGGDHGSDRFSFCISAFGHHAVISGASGAYSDGGCPIPPH